MKQGSILTISSMTVVVVLSICVANEHGVRLKLVEENHTLQEQLRQMKDVIAKNEEFSNTLEARTRARSLPDRDLRELLRLRGEVGVRRQATKDLVAARDQNRQAHAAVESKIASQNSSATNAFATANYWPRESWTFAGYATPDATLQSSLWAANNGDFKALMASATESMQKEMEAEFGGKSDTEASVRAMDTVMALKAVRVLNREIRGVDTVVLTTAMEGRGGTETGKLILKQIANEWKLSGIAE